MDEQERRQLPRWQVKREAKVWLPLMQEFSHCIIEDINMKGMRASFNKRLPVDRSINMSLALEDNFEFIKLEAMLPWEKMEQGRYVYGMSFSKIMDWDKDRLDQYINCHCSDQFKEKWWGQGSL
jgi:hypothetical protein